MLDIHFLNVQHGDSIVIEYQNDGQRNFAVVDSNVSGTARPAALNKLQVLGADNLSFACITHPHADHYKGMHDILKHYTGSISHFYTFPIGDLTANQDRLKKYAKQLRSIISKNDDAEITRRSVELIQILRCANDDFGRRQTWFELCSSMLMEPPGFQGVILKVLLPPPKVKGEKYIQQMISEDLNDPERLDANDLSIAIQIEYAGKKVILGGDAPSSNWQYHKRIYQRDAGIDSDVVKLPHHGSKHDCDDDTLPMWFSQGGERIGIVSANGNTHPDSEVLEWMLNNNVRPYCTNLSKSWDINSNVSDFINTSGLEGNLQRFVRQFAVERSKRIQPCKGDIKVSISAQGELSINTEYNNICGCDANIIEDLFG